MSPSILAGRDQMALDNGMNLRLLSALEVLQARREADGLCRSSSERALCSNACLLARALETQEGEPVFSSGEAVLSGLRVEEISALARTWSQFNREENPPLTLSCEQAEQVKKSSRGRRGPAALESAAGLWRSAHRGAGPADAGPGLSVVSHPHGIGPGGRAGAALPQLPGSERAGSVSRLRPAHRGRGGWGKSQL